MTSFIYNLFDSIKYQLNNHTSFLIYTSTNNRLNIIIHNDNSYIYNIDNVHIDKGVTIDILFDFEQDIFVDLCNVFGINMIVKCDLTDEQIDDYTYKINTCELFIVPYIFNLCGIFFRLDEHKNHNIKIDKNNNTNNNNTDNSDYFVTNVKRSCDYDVDNSNDDDDNENYNNKKRIRVNSV